MSCVHERTIRPRFLIDRRERPDYNQRDRAFGLARMVTRVGVICLTAFPEERGGNQPRRVHGEPSLRLRHLGAGETRLIYTRTFPMDDLAPALKYARERIDDATKVVVSTQPGIVGGAKSKRTKT